MSLEKEIAENLLNKEAVKVSIEPPFTWVSGIKSPVYCDNRKMISFPEERKAVVEGFKTLLEEKGLKPDVLGGTATAAIPWAAFLAYELDLPMIYIRPEKKEHGAGKQIEGHLEEGQNVLIIEDLISTGGSSVKAAEAVREAGAKVDDIFAIVTWEIPKSISRFEEANLSLSTLTDYTNIIGLASEKGVIPSDQLDAILQFKEDPASWGEKMGF
ncbi:orotate phosphoribosyltransferase [Candidatus Peregrinibacteria bacterium]|nr:orotate phosphoribosyltransferase [Candidatus Peregrinibacteria bacterium]